jgi:hypothetical protein
VPFKTINGVMKVYKKDECAKKILRYSMTFDKKMLIMGMGHEFPNHTSEQLTRQVT